MIAAWQKARNNPPTGYLTGAQNQALLRDAAPAVSRFDEEQKKLDEARKKADEEKAKAEAANRAAPPPPQAAAAPPAAPAPNSAAAATPKSGPDGTWKGTLQCTPSRNGGEFLFHLLINVSGGTRHLGASRLGARYQRRPVGQHPGQRTRRRGLARLRAGQSAGRPADRDHARPVRRRFHHLRRRPGAQWRRPELPDRPDAAMTRAAALI